MPTLLNYRKKQDRFHKNVLNFDFSEIKNKCLHRRIADANFKYSIIKRKYNYFKIVNKNVWKLELSIIRIKELLLENPITNNKLLEFLEMEKSLIKKYKKIIFRNTLTSSKNRKYSKKCLSYVKRILRDLKSSFVQQHESESESEASLVLPYPTSSNYETVVNCTCGRVCLNFCGNYQNIS